MREAPLADAPDERQLFAAEHDLLVVVLVVQRAQRGPPRIGARQQPVLQPKSAATPLVVQTARLSKYAPKPAQ